MKPPDLGDHCPVYILDKYISKLPPKAKEDDLFYVRPVEKNPVTTDAPWYSAVPIGKNTLQNMVTNMCSEANIQGAKTNHSLRATAATHMFQSGIPEKVIQERTGHRSLEGLRSYERLSEQQHKTASKLLSSSSQNSLVPTPAAPPNLPGSKQLIQRQSKTVCFNTPAAAQPPCLDLHDLHGCTITINNNTYNPPASTNSYEERYLDQLFSEVKDY